MDQPHDPPDQEGAIQLPLSAATIIGLAVLLLVVFIVAPDKAFGPTRS